MNKQSIFFTCIVAIVATTLLLMIIQFVAKKQNIKSEINNKMSISYAIWISSIIIPFFIFLKVALEQTENTIEVIIFSKEINDTFIQVMQRIAIYTGFTFIFTFLSYYIIHNILKFTIGNRIDSIEIEKENNGYFITKAVLTIALVLSLIKIFEDFLRWFAPIIETPFYH